MTFIWKNVRKTLVYSIWLHWLTMDLNCPNCGKEILGQWHSCPSFLTIFKMKNNTCFQISTDTSAYGYVLSIRYVYL